ncbi:MAG: phage protein Gp37/Gp68 [Clostridiaceae bacterium BRH_c20a]|nr:MAG: phage protein Gp37/Gp68 [Clostridiaceae bacterium BRH_c20a]
MALNSKIEWTESTWNPVTGCTKVSEGCKNCYAFTMGKRLKLMGNAKYANGFNVTLHSYCIEDPLKWKKPSIIFVNSMSDLFHDEVPFRFIESVFDVMNKATLHTFQILTKRADRLAELAPYLNWTPNIWQGVTVENENYTNRINFLRKVRSKVRFISFEPLLGEVRNLDLSEIDWAIVGGESGPNAREIKTDWVLSIKEQCDSQGVLFYFKQWGGTNKKKSGRLLLGRTWDEMPKVANLN